MRLYKDHVFIQTQQVMPKTQHTLINVATRLRPKWDNPKPFKRRIRLHVDSISNKQRNYGEGTFNVLIHSDRVPSKRFSKNFICLKDRGCGYYLNGSCKIWKRHQKGWQCKMNRRWHPNMKKACRITVRELNDGFAYDWHKEHSRMGRFWFWRDKA